MQQHFPVNERDPRQEIDTFIQIHIYIHIMSHVKKMDDPTKATSWIKTDRVLFFWYTIIGETYVIT